MENHLHPLTTRQQHLITISALTATNNVAQLPDALHAALDAGLTINEINEELAHIYAYCGFPASSRATNQFKQVVNERVACGIHDVQGPTASPITDTADTYARGEQNQMLVTGSTVQQLAAAFSFSPVLDRFLKEHLFADIFGRDVLSFLERELVTVSALAATHEPLVQPHFHGALNVGVTEPQLHALLALIETVVGAAPTNAARQLLDKVLVARQTSTSAL